MNPNHNTYPHLFHHLLTKHSITKLNLTNHTHLNFTGERAHEAQLILGALRPCQHPDLHHLRVINPLILLINYSAGRPTI